MTANFQRDIFLGGIARLGKKSSDSRRSIQGRSEGVLRQIAKIDMTWHVSDAKQLSDRLSANPRIMPTTFERFSNIGLNQKV